MIEGKNRVKKCHYSPHFNQKHMKINVFRRKAATRLIFLLNRLHLKYTCMYLLGVTVRRYENRKNKQLACMYCELRCKLLYTLILEDLMKKTKFNWTLSHLK
jgi:hypothetical protein